jgi:Cyclic nucleotide-binding domain
MHVHNCGVRYCVDSEQVLVQMFEGHYFGELALIFDEPRNASVRAISTVNCMYISKEVSSHVCMQTLSLKLNTLKYTVILS